MVKAINPMVHVQVAWMDQSDQKLVERVITHYAAPKGCCDGFAHVVYRVWNAILSVFGMSDWQRAVRALKKAVPQKIEQAVGAALIEGKDGQPVGIDLTRARKWVTTLPGKMAPELAARVPEFIAIAEREKGSPLSDKEKAKMVSALSRDNTAKIASDVSATIDKVAEAAQAPVEQLANDAIKALGLGKMKASWFSAIPCMVMKETNCAEAFLEALVFIQEGAPKTKIEAAYQKTVREVGTWLKNNKLRIQETPLVKAILQGALANPDSTRALTQRFHALFAALQPQVQEAVEGVAQRPEVGALFGLQSGQKGKAF